MSVSAAAKLAEAGRFLDAFAVLHRNMRARDDVALAEEKAAKEARERLAELERSMRSAMVQGVARAERDSKALVRVGISREAQLIGIPRVAAPERATNLEWVRVAAIVAAEEGLDVDPKPHQVQGSCDVVTFTAKSKGSENAHAGEVPSASAASSSSSLSSNTPAAG